MDPIHAIFCTYIISSTSDAMLIISWCIDILHRSTSMQGKLLKHNLAAEVVDALKDLRDQLSQNEMRR